MTVGLRPSEWQASEHAKTLGDLTSCREELEGLRASLGSAHEALAELRGQLAEARSERDRWGARIGVLEERHQQAILVLQGLKDWKNYDDS